MYALLDWCAKFQLLAGRVCVCVCWRCLVVVVVVCVCVCERERERLFIGMFDLMCLYDIYINMVFQLL